MSQKYIVTFSKSATEDEIKRSKSDLISNGGQITNEYDMPGFKGFAGFIPDGYVGTLQSLQGGLIDTFEPDGVVTTQ